MSAIINGTPYTTQGYGTFTPTVTGTYLVICQGAGGNGMAGASGNSGAGGGGGATSTSWLTLTKGTTYYYYIGTPGGSAGSLPSNLGTADTYWSGTSNGATPTGIFPWAAGGGSPNLYTKNASGGFDLILSNPQGNNNAGGSGGAGVGTSGSNGGGGGGSQYFGGMASNASTGASGGAGGAGLNAGGNGGTPVSNNGQNGAGPGAGAGGGYYGSSAYLGGTGGPGAITIYWVSSNTVRRNCNRRAGSRSPIFT